MQVLLILIQEKPDFCSQIDRLFDESKLFERVSNLTSTD